MNKRSLLFIIFFAFIILSCKENDYIPESDSFLSSFESLTTEKDTLFKGQSTTITAIATGYKILFKWYATDGDILGTGNQIIYMASPCCIGNSTITCEATANNRSESKSLIITVLQ